MPSPTPAASTPAGVADERARPHNDVAPRARSCRALRKRRSFARRGLGVQHPGRSRRRKRARRNGAGGAHSPRVLGHVRFVGRHPYRVWRYRDVQHVRVRHEYLGWHVQHCRGRRDLHRWTDGGLLHRRAEDGDDERHPHRRHVLAAGWGSFRSADRRRGWGRLPLANGPIGHGVHVQSRGAWKRPTCVPWAPPRRIWLRISPRRAPPCST